VKIRIRNKKKGALFSLVSKTAFFASRASDAL